MATEKKHFLILISIYNILIDFLTQNNTYVNKKFKKDVALQKHSIFNLIKINYFLLSKGNLSSLLILFSCLFLLCEKRLCSVENNINESIKTRPLWADIAYAGLRKIAYPNEDVFSHFARNQVLQNTLFTSSALSVFAAIGVLGAQTYNLVTLWNHGYDAFFCSVGSFSLHIGIPFMATKILDTLSEWGVLKNQTARDTIKEILSLTAALVPYPLLQTDGVSIALPFGGEYFTNALWSGFFSSDKADLCLAPSLFKSSYNFSEQQKGWCVENSAGNFFAFSSAGAQSAIHWGDNITQWVRLIPHNVTNITISTSVVDSLFPWTNKDFWQTILVSVDSVVSQGLAQVLPWKIAKAELAHHYSPEEFVQGVRLTLARCFWDYPWTPQLRFDACYERLKKAKAFLKQEKEILPARPFEVKKVRQNKRNLSDQMRTITDILKELKRPDSIPFTHPLFDLTLDLHMIRQNLLWLLLNDRLPQNLMPSKVEDFLRLMQAQSQKYLEKQFPFLKNPDTLWGEITLQLLAEENNSLLLSYNIYLVTLHPYQRHSWLALIMMESFFQTFYQ